MKWQRTADGNFVSTDARFGVRRLNSLERKAPYFVTYLDGREIGREPRLKDAKEIAERVAQRGG